MDPSRQSDESVILAGDRVQVRAGDGAWIVGVVEQAEEGGAALQVRATAPLAPGIAQLRRIDASGAAFRADVSVQPDVGVEELALLTLTTPWTRDAVRSSQRISGSRHSVRGEAVAGSLPPGARLDLVCLDVSAGGCRMTGVGRGPRDGDLVRLGLTHPHEGSRAVLARVVRVNPLTFGRYELGLRFETDTADERSWLAHWRDAWAYAAQADDSRLSA
jgi:hypothetical protein